MVVDVYTVTQDTKAGVRCGERMWTAPTQLLSIADHGVDE
jgi:hypothetical protein